MPVNLDIIGKKLDASVYEYCEKDVILYALGVGCGPEHLQFVYEQDLEVLPTFAVIPAFPALFAMGSAMQVNPMMVLHGEQRIELYGPIPTSGKLTTTPTVAAALLITGSARSFVRVCTMMRPLFSSHISVTIVSPG